MSKLPQLCYSPRYLALVIGAALLMVGAALVAKPFERGSAVRIAMALIQAAATAVGVIVSMRSLRQLDELQQRIQLEALAFSFAGTGVLATGYGFLVSAGLPNIEWGVLVWPTMVALWAVGLVIANRHYR